MLGVWVTVSQCWTDQLLHLKFYLIKSRERPDPGDDGVDEAGGDVPPLPSLLLVPGGGSRHQQSSQQVGEKEGGGSRENGPGHCERHLSVTTPT